MCLGLFKDHMPIFIGISSLCILVYEGLCDVNIYKFHVEEFLSSNIYRFTHNTRQRNRQTETEKQEYSTVIDLRLILS